MAKIPEISRITVSMSDCEIENAIKEIIPRDDEIIEEQYLQDRAERVVIVSVSMQTNMIATFVSKSKVTTPEICQNLVGKTCTVTLLVEQAFRRFAREGNRVWDTNPNNYDVTTTTILADGTEINIRNLIQESAIIHDPEMLKIHLKVINGKRASEDHRKMLLNDDQFIKDPLAATEIVNGLAEVGRDLDHRVNQPEPEPMDEGSNPSKDAAVKTTEFDSGAPINSENPLPKEMQAVKKPSDEHTQGTSTSQGSQTESDHEDEYQKVQPKRRTIADWKMIPRPESIIQPTPETQSMMNKNRARNKQTIIDFHNDVLVKLNAKRLEALRNFGLALTNEYVAITNAENRRPKRNRDESPQAKGANKDSKNARKSSK